MKLEHEYILTTNSCSTIPMILTNQLRVNKLVFYQERCLSIGSSN